MKHIRMQADDFFNAYLVLEENNKLLIKRLNNASENPAKLETIMGVNYTGVVDIVCLAFSIELYVKTLLNTLDIKIPREHNILKLFKKLPKKTQQEIFNHDSIIQNPFCTQGDKFSAKRFTNEHNSYDGFIEQLNAISDGFEKWRYSYEKTTLKYETFFALAFIESLRSAIDNALNNQII